MKTRHDNDGKKFNGHVFIDGGLWPSWEAYGRHVAKHGTYDENVRRDGSSVGTDGRRPGADS